MTHTDMLKSIGIIIITSALLGGCSPSSTQEADTSVYMDPTRPVEERVEALLSQMTLPEKIGQMEMVTVWDKDSILKNGYYDFGAWLADVGPEEANELQRVSEQTRLKIPYLIGMDAAHGHAMLQGRTIYPTSISMAATCALVASPCGTRVASVTPVITPAPQAHCMAGMAYSLKSAKSA